MRRVLAIVTVAVTALVGAASASANDSFVFGDATIKSAVHVNGDVATVKVRYSCDVGDHIWVSAKQNASATVDPAVAAEGSGFGDVAAAWWQSHRGSFTCDGNRHTALFEIDTVEPGSRGELHSGWAWVQFCITTGPAFAPSAIVMQWVPVYGNKLQSPGQPV
jgi:hypothetical protein